MMPHFKPLDRTFFARDTHVVAKQLLGKVVVRIHGHATAAGRITEVERYVGEDDLACHAARGRTPRTERMYGEAGHAYIFLIYGMYHCLNVVTDRKEFPAAVLIRSLEPLVGGEHMQKVRGGHDVHKLTSGPGKLTQALAITRALNGTDMTKIGPLYIADDGFRLNSRLIATSPRIGVAYAGASALLPWRYYIANSPFVSKK